MNMKNKMMKKKNFLFWLVLVFVFSLLALLSKSWGKSRVLDGGSDRKIHSVHNFPDLAVSLIIKTLVITTSGLLFDVDIVARVRIGEIEINGFVYSRKIKEMSPVAQKEDYKLILSVIKGFDYVLILEDDYRLCTNIDDIKWLIQENRRVAYQLSYGAVALVFHASFINRAIELLEGSVLPVDNTFGVSGYFSKTSINLVVEDRKGKSTLGHESTPGQCFDICVDTGLFVFDYNSCSSDLFPCDQTTTKFLQWDKPDHKVSHNCLNKGMIWAYDMYSPLLSWSGDINVFTRTLLNEKWNNKENYYIKPQRKYYTIWFGDISKYKEILQHNILKLPSLLLFSDRQVEGFETTVIDPVVTIMSKFKYSRIISELCDNFRKNEKWAIVHVSDILRIILSKENWVYFDMDFLWLHPEILPSGNFFTVNKRMYDENIYIPNGMFSIDEDIKDKLLSDVTISYNPKSWASIGPNLIKSLIPAIINKIKVVDWDLVGGQKMETQEVLYSNKITLAQQLLLKMFECSVSIHVGNIYIDEFNKLSQLNTSLIYQLMVK